MYDLVIEKLPYVTIFVFFLGVVLRLNRWLRASKDPADIEIDLFASIKQILLDVVLFRKQFKTDKVSWFFIFLFHMSIAGIMFGHMRGFKWWSASMFNPLGHDLAYFMVKQLPIYVGWAFLASQIFLLIRRIFLEKSHLLSLPNDYIALVLILIASIFGQGMRILPPEAIPTKQYSVVFIPKLIVLHLEKVPNHLFFFLHTLFTQLFVMYIPYSKLIHIFSGLITTAIYGSRRAKYDL